MARRCICGASKAWPICDGSHSAHDWSCRVERRTPLCFVAGEHHAHIAERLAHELGGTVAHLVEEPVRADRAVVLTDGTDLAEVQALFDRVDAAEVRVIGVGTGEALLVAAFPGAHVVALDDTSRALWRRVLHASSERRDPAVLAPLSDAFVTHSVADEAVLQPIVDYLRKRASADLFLCADSLPAGSSWSQVLQDELRRRQRLIFVLSEASRDSTFCAFELGFALAIGKPVYVVSLDGATPPAFAQHLQMIDPTRLQARQPWLSLREAQIRGFIDALRGHKPPEPDVGEVR